MKIELRFFASLREALGISQETIEVPASVTTIAELRSLLTQRDQLWSEVLGQGRAIRCALDHHIVDFNTPLQEGAEVAFFPPVTGG